MICRQTADSYNMSMRLSQRQVQTNVWYLEWSSEEHWYRVWSRHKEHGIRLGDTRTPGFKWVIARHWSRICCQDDHDCDSRQPRPRKRTISTRSLNDAVSSLERFHRRTISTSDMRGSRSGYSHIGDEEESLDTSQQHSISFNTNFACGIIIERTNLFLQIQSFNIYHT